MHVLVAVIHVYAVGSSGLLVRLVYAGSNKEALHLTALFLVNFRVFGDRPAFRKIMVCASFSVPVFFLLAQLRWRYRSYKLAHNTSVSGLSPTKYSFLVH
ncbi:hypothetical protein DPMN_016530 [Dreissena polymorpha]|uniref:Uncharacterized protein n=1 Tax=Dreissena polymorpha TaxID=45954 RepID=A0A9D4S797_DREPO|nr:hypothetical protein DPMN_016530 [Dreissena polymorpha]